MLDAAGGRSHVDGAQGQGHADGKTEKFANRLPEEIVLRWPRLRGSGRRSVPEDFSRNRHAVDHAAFRGSRKFLPEFAETQIAKDPEGGWTEDL